MCNNQERPKIKTLSAEEKKLIKNSEGYKDFTILDKPIKLGDFMADKDDVVVETHSSSVWEVNGEKRILGFCGKFRWKDKNVIPLDGDSYNKDMTVYGYRWWLEDVLVFILVGDDW
jgi:hypothetical protein